jgi:type II secretory pathway predicted ATPase ExeA
MYEKFFELTKAPFSLVSDPDCIYLTTQHADVISGLAFGVLDRKGYLVLTAEAGLGKTTAIRALSQLLSDSNGNMSVILAPTLTGTEFLEMVMLNFGFRDLPPSKALRLKMFEEFLIRSNTQGKVSALVVDEAHQLSPELLEELRLLGNFEAGDRKLLQIVLVGQNQLNDQLDLPQLWQFKQRISIRLSLRPLDRQAVKEYIDFRWAKAGGGKEAPFSSDAVDAISSWSTGIPRLINIICDNALLIAFSQNAESVEAEMVSKACRELGLAPAAVPETDAPFSGARPLVLPETAEGMSTNGDHADADAWGNWRSSVFKRLRGRNTGQRTRSRSSILSLNEPGE